MTQGQAMNADFAVSAIGAGRAALDRFLAANPHIPVKLAHLSDPASVDRAALLANRVIAEANQYGADALGRAVSHAKLWSHCANSGTITHIADSGVVLRADFASAIAGAIAASRGFDILVWAYDFSIPARIELAPGTEGRLMHEQSTHAPDITAFRAGTTRVGPFPLRQCGQPLGYTLSPAGARKLLARCLPFSNTQLAYFGSPQINFANDNLGTEMARQFPGLAAFIAHPPLAVMPQTVAPETLGWHVNQAVETLALPHACPRVPAPAP
jgi:hypothetical protein